MSENARDNIPSENEEHGTEEGSAPERALTPLDERRVEFYGDDLRAALIEVNDQQRIAVPLRPIAEYLGLNWSAQLQRTRRNEILDEALISVFITHTETGRGKGSRAVLCLLIEQLPAWLFGVEAGRVKPELQAKVKQYQRECAAVLWRAFQADALAGVGVQSDSESDSAIAVLEQIRSNALAVAQLAEQQIDLERRQKATEKRVQTVIDRSAAVFDELRERLTVVEKRTVPQQVISDEQAEEVASAVKALAEYLTTKNPAEKWYQSVYNALYKQFGVTSYKRIRKGQLERVMAFLDDWRSAAGNDEPKPVPEGE